MKKRIALLLFIWSMGSFIQIDCAETAAGVSFRPNPWREGAPKSPLAIKNALFMLGHQRMRPRRTLFDTYRFEPTNLAYASRAEFPIIYNNQLDAFQDHIFVPDTANNRVLIFLAHEDGQFELDDTLPTSQAPIDVSVVEHKGLLYLFVAHATNAVEVHRFDGEHWIRTSTYQALPIVEPSMRDYTIAPLAIKAVTFNDQVYCFMVHEQVPYPLVGKLDDRGQLTAMNQITAIQLPISPHFATQNISYTIEAVPYNNSLYLFVGGEAGSMREGFVRIGAMNTDETFQDRTSVATRANKLVPNSMAVMNLGDRAFIYVSFDNVNQAELYTLSSVGLEQDPIALNWIPKQMRTLEQDGKPYLIVLNAPRVALPLIDVYEIRDTGKVRLLQADLVIGVPRPLRRSHYQNFVIIPYLTQEEVVEAIDVGTEQQIPLEVLKEMSKFVTPVSKVPTGAASAE